MAEDRSSRPKAKAASDAPRGASTGRRPGRHTTYQAEAYRDPDGLPPVEPQALLDPESTGAVENAEGFYQQTAMLDKGELLGELAEIAEVPSTRAAVEAESPPRGCRLIVVAGPEIGAEWGFKQPEVVIGRDEECALMLTDIGVSRRHAKITLEGTKFVLTDFGSGNGTFLNGVRIQREELASGDEIVIGERTMRFVELNEAPPTAAAHPVSGRLVPEPAIGSASKVVVAREQGLGKVSQVDVRAVPSADGPAAPDSLQAPAPGAPKAARPGSALRSMLRAAGVVLLLLACGAGVFFYIRHREAQRIEAERIASAKREFLQGIELVKAKRFGDALVLFGRVLSVQPDHARALEYKEHCEKELKVWDTIEAARRLATAKRHAEAVGLLEGIKEQTAYQREIEKLKSAWSRAVAEGMLPEAKTKLAAGDFDGALEIVQAALAQSPSLENAARLREAIEDARREAGRPKPKAREPLPPELMRAVALYKNDQISAAIDAAEAAGGTSSTGYVSKMRRVKQLIAEVEQAHRKKAGADLLRLAPAALEIDQQISEGDGRVRAKLKGFYADGLYLKAIEAYQEKDFVRAYQLLNEALAQKPGHQLSETRLAELTRKARDLYFDGYGLKDSNTAETRKIFRRVTQMTKPDNQYHRLAQKWLAANGG